MTSPERVELRNAEYRGWTYTLGIEIEEGCVALDTFWRAGMDEPTPAAFRPAEALGVAAEIAKAAGRALEGSHTAEGLNAFIGAVSDLQAIAAQVQNEAIGATLFGGKAVRVERAAEGRQAMSDDEAARPEAAEAEHESQPEVAREEEVRGALEVLTPRYRELLDRLGP